MFEGGVRAAAGYHNCLSKLGRQDDRFEGLLRGRSLAPYKNKRSEIYLGLYQRLGNIVETAGDEPFEYSDIRQEVLDESKLTEPTGVEDGKLTKDSFQGSDHLNKTQVYCMAQRVSDASRVIREYVPDYSPNNEIPDSFSSRKNQFQAFIRSELEHICQSLEPGPA